LKEGATFFEAHLYNEASAFIFGYARGGGADGGTLLQKVPSSPGMQSTILKLGTFSLFPTNKI